MRSSLRILFFLTLGLIMAMDLGVSAEASPSAQAETPGLAPTPAPSVLRGVVTLNGKLAPAGVGIAASLGEKQCGTSTTQ